MPAYLQADILTKAEALGLKARTIVEGLRVGDHKSPYRGFSVEFVQHREYVPGDDIRHIDWKSYGRSERYTIKQYEQETNFVGHLLLDASRSMLYGEGDENKLEYAKLLTASLAYLIIHQRDSAGLTIFDDRIRAQLPASGQIGHLQTILQALVSTRPEQRTAIGPLLQQVAEKVRRRGLVFLVSDCLDDLEGLLKGLQFLRFQGHEVILFHVLHNDELTFPFDGMIRFEGLELPQELMTRPNLIQKAYLRALGDYRNRLRAGCDAHRVDYVLLDTSRPLDTVLSAYLSRRALVRRV